MILRNGFADVLRRLMELSFADDSSSDVNDEYPEDLAGMASVLSVTIEPRAQFVDSLGQMLSSMEHTWSSAREPARPAKFTWRRVAMRIVFAAAVLAIFVLLAIFVDLPSP